EAVHGVPGPRVLRPGDVGKLDVTADKDGFVADAARTVVVGAVPGAGRRLAGGARAAVARPPLAAPAGDRTRAVRRAGQAGGRGVRAEVRRRGFFVLPELAGHGVGRSIHEPPCVPNYDEPRATDPLTEGLVITVEPIISAGRSRALEAPDGWTIRTADGSLAA